MYGLRIRSPLKDAMTENNALNLLTRRHLGGVTLNAKHIDHIWHMAVDHLGPTDHLSFKTPRALGCAYTDAGETDSH